MTWTEKDGFKLIENQLNANDADTVAVANFTNAINETGWSYLEVTTYPQFPDKVQVGGSVFEFHQGILVFRCEEKSFLGLNWGWSVFNYDSVHR